MRENLQKSLDKIRPVLQRDGGDVELVDVNDEGVVSVRLKGACGNCPGSLATLKGLIETTLKSEVAGVKEVVKV